MEVQSGEVIVVRIFPLEMGWGEGTGRPHEERGEDTAEAVADTATMAGTSVWAVDWDCATTMRGPGQGRAVTTRGAVRRLAVTVRGAEQRRADTMRGVEDWGRANMTRGVAWRRGRIIRGRK